MTNKKHFLKKTLATALVASSTLTASITAWANELRSADFAAISQDSFEILLSFSEDAPELQGYAIEQPARLVFDFAGVDSALTQRSFDLGFSNADTVRILETDDRLRMVVELSEVATYKTTYEGNDVRITVGNAEAKAYHANSVSQVDTFVKDPTDDKVKIQNFDFTRDNTGAGVITFSLSDENAIVAVDRNSRGLEVQFKNTQAPAHLLKQYDVNDFGTPVSRVQVLNSGNNAVVTVEPSTEYFDYLAYQLDNKYQISMSPLTEAEIEESKHDFSGKRMSFDFQNIDIRTALQLLADSVDLNLVMSDSVAGDVTITVDNVRWDHFLDILLKSNGLDKRLDDNVLMIAPTEELAAREQAELANKAKLKELAPLVTEHIRIRYADAMELYELFDKAGEDSGKSMLSDRGRAVVDSRTNSIILTDTADNISEFISLIDKLDVEVRQVAIESRIVIAGSDARRDLGIRWGFDRASTRPTQAGQSSTIGSGTIDSVIQVANNETVVYGGEDGAGALVVDLGAQPKTGNPAAVALGFLSGNQNFITLELSALEAEGMAQVVSQPKVITGDKQPAIIKSGSEIPYQQATSSGATAVQFKDAVLSLEVTPQITPDNRIIMDLKVTKDSIGEIVAGVPTIDVTTIETRVSADNGQTVVLGGIFETSEVDNVTGVPVLKDIPGIGNLFKSRTKSGEKTETLIFITPKILASELDTAGQRSNMLGDQAESETPSYYK